MEKKLALHIFRRDLRVDDNTALKHSFNSSEKVIPCFIFDKRQVENNKYKSNNALQFMINSIQDLDTQIRKNGGRLYLFYGYTEDILKQLINKFNLDLVSINRDYTPFSRYRDNKLQTICEQLGIEFKKFSDILLTEPEQVHKDDGKPYTVFTPFYKKARKVPIKKPIKNNKKNYFTQPIDFEENYSIFEKILPKPKYDVRLKGGREEGLKLMQKDLSYYKEIRDYPRYNTSLLSAHNKFGTISIRELYHHSKDDIFISQLYWRDFYTHIIFHFPHVLGNPFRQKFKKLEWENDKTLFQAWCEGNTGFPIVDAGMRELNQTGYMHNRVRMITASFLIKDLNIDWQWGEKYFAQKLIDYDPAVNNGNWQWVASTGSDSQPYFRIFNPWRQQQRFDKNCEYIKKWVPELEKLTPKEIHNLHKKHSNIDYPKAIVDHQKQAEQAKAKYATISKL